MFFFSSDFHHPLILASSHPSIFKKKYFFSLFSSHINEYNNMEEKQRGDRKRNETINWKYWKIIEKLAFLILEFCFFSTRKVKKIAVIKSFHRLSAEQKFSISLITTAKL